MPIQKHRGNWTDLRGLFGITRDDEIDFHFGRSDFGTPYEKVMVEVASLVEGKLRKAQEKGRPYVMFIHGWSTSRRGKTTARSVVRAFMRSSTATPLIERAGCVQHETVFVAKIRHARRKAASHQ